MDVGHMNIRQRCMELIEPEDFIASFEALQLPIVEVHLHDNKSFPTSICTWAMERCRSRRSSQG